MRRAPNIKLSERSIGVAAPAFDRNIIIQVVVAVLVTGLVLAPFFPIVYQALIDRPIYQSGAGFSLAGFESLVQSPRLGLILFNTAFLATAATIISVGFGVFAAVVLTRTDVPFRGVIRETLMWPLYVPHLVLGLGWISMYGPAGFASLFVESVIGFQPWNLYSIFGIAVVAGVAQAPLTYLYCAPAAERTSSSIEDAARIAGASPLKVLFTITLPLMRPGIVTSAVINFVIAIEMLSIPLIFGGPVNIEVWTTFIYHQLMASSTPNYTVVAAACFPLLAVVAGLMYLQGKLLAGSERFVTVIGKSAVVRIFALGSWRWAVFAVLAAYVFFGIILVLGGVFLRSFVVFLSPLIPIWNLFTLNNYATVFSQPTYINSIYNSLTIGVVGGAIATLFITIVILIVQRSNFPWRRSLEFIINIPRALPGIIIGIGVFYALLLVPPLGWLRNTIWILVIAYTMRYIPIAIAAIGPTLVQIDRSIDQSGRIAGGDWWSTSTKIIFPMLRSAILSCYVILFIRFFNEYVTAVFIVAPGSEVIGSTMLTFWANGYDGPVTALATFQVIITFLVVYLARWALRVKTHV